MPYKIQRSGEQFCVVKETTGKKMGCHPSKAEAEKQLAALYANEPGMGKAYSMEAPKKRKNRILRSLVIKEISGVDKAAQVPAEALLMKRADPTEKNFYGECYERPVLTTEAEGHTHLLEDKGPGGQTSYSISEGEDTSHSHPWVRGLDGSITIGAADGHTHEVLETNKSATGGEEGTDPMTETKKNEEIASVALEAAQKLITEVTKRAERAEAITKLNADERGMFDALKEGQDEFLAKSAEQRAQLIRESKEADKVVFKSLDGQIYRASDDPRLVALAKKSDADAKATAEAIAKAEQVTLEKRANEEIPHVPGTVEVRAGILKALNGVAGAPEFLKAAETALAKAFVPQGTSTGADLTKAEDKLETLAKSYAETKKVSIEKARAAVLETAEGAALYAEIDARSVTAPVA